MSKLLNNDVAINRQKALLGRLFSFRRHTSNSSAVGGATRESWNLEEGSGVVTVIPV